MLRIITRSITNTTSFLMLFLGLSMQVTAQIDSTRVFVHDGYIEKMRDYIAIENSVNNDYEIFELKNNGTELQIAPNIGTNYRIQVNYKFILAGFQFAPKLFPDNRDNDTKGETNSFNFKVKMVFDHFYHIAQYSKNQGYYLKNSADYTNIENGYIVFPDLHYHAIELESGYIHNSKFSYRSITSHMERQIKSAGTFLPILKLRFYNLDDRSSSINTQKTNNIEFTLGPGYAYNFVISKNFYSTIGGLVSLGNIHTKLTTRLENEAAVSYQNNLLIQWQGKIGLGYNGRKFYSGVFATLSETNYNQEHTTATNFETRVFFNFFVGFRIKPPKFIQKNADKIESKLGF